jgi:hypothetical protein
MKERRAIPAAANAGRVAVNGGWYQTYLNSMRVTLVLQI